MWNTTATAEVQITLPNKTILNDDQLRKAKQAMRLLVVELTHQKEELEAFIKKYEDILKEQGKEHENQLKEEATLAIKIVQSCSGQEKCKNDFVELAKLRSAYTIKLKNLETRKNEIAQNIEKINQLCSHYLKEKEAFEKNITDYETESLRQKQEQSVVTN